jgi:hypothetical protein
MKFHLPICAVCLACGSTALAQDRFARETADDSMLKRRNRFSLKSTFNFNIKSEFTSATPINSGALVPGVNRTYDDGYVLRDISGNAGGKTWNWGYSSASQFTASDAALPAPNTGAPSLAFHTAASLADGQTRGSRDKVLPGIELSYEEVLGRFNLTERRRANFGILLSVGYLRLLTTDKCLPGGVLPPLPPYNGSFSTAGPLLPDVPVERATTAVNATGTLNNRHTGSLYGFNLGPFLELPLHDRVSLSLGAGLGVVYASTTYEFQETVVVPGVVTAARSGRVSADSWLFSTTARANLYVGLSPAWSWELGLAYQFAGNTRSTVQGKSANLQLDSILSLNTGLNYAF